MRSERAHDLPSTRALFFVLIFLKVLLSHLSGLPEAAESVISELLSNIFNIIILRYSKTDIFVLVSWTLHYTKFWGCCSSPLRMGTTQCFFCDCTAVNLCVQHICCICLRTWLRLTDPNRTTLANVHTREMSVSVWPETWMYLCTGAHHPPSLNHVVPSCQLSLLTETRHSAPGTLNPPLSPPSYTSSI